MAILITGGCGYIGSHTCLEMLSAGYDIVVLDNYYNAKPGRHRVINRIVDDLFPRRANRRNLLEPPKPAAHPRSHNHQSRSVLFHRNRPFRSGKLRKNAEFTRRTTCLLKTAAIRV